MIYAWIERDDGADRGEFHRAPMMVKRSLNDLRDEMRAVPYIMARLDYRHCLSST